MYLPLLLSLTLESRISETLGLRYSDVDFSAETIYIRIQLGRSIEDNSEESLLTKPIKTKTKNSVRSVPAPRWVIDEILVRRIWYEKQKQHVPGFFDQGYICCHSDGSSYHRSHFGEDFHKPVRMKAISEFLGHYSPEFTEEVYVYQEEKFMTAPCFVRHGKSVAPKMRKMSCSSHFRTQITMHCLHNRIKTSGSPHFVSKNRVFLP